MDLWYKIRKGKTPINFGVSVGHIPVRISVMGDQPAFLPPADSRGAKQRATPKQIEEIKKKIEQKESPDEFLTSFVDSEVKKLQDKGLWTEKYGDRRTQLIFIGCDLDKEKVSTG